MKILYAGSPEPSRKTLEILFENQKKYGFEIVGVLSNPPSAKGRHKELTPTPVAQFALEQVYSLYILAIAKDEGLFRHTETLQET